ncbi:MAG: hypothetical protein U9N86_01165 [Bacteroidota bacterium]|nr:hypothetical protein [Bacteroidota bacterium]
MNMDFNSAAKFGSYISKDYAKDMFRLLGSYRNLSASEAASRLNLHIKTVQDFLEAMTSLDILSKEEVFEKKRPYYRYTLKKNNIRIDLELFSQESHIQPDSALLKMIRERKNANVRFTTSRSNNYLSSVVIWIGEGRGQNERKINLTTAQGKFLYNLPFPNADYLSIASIMKKAGVDEDYKSEIMDIVGLLLERGVLESVGSRTR